MRAKSTTSPSPRFSSDTFSLLMLEPRYHQSVTSWTSDLISNLSGTSFGDVQMGDNGSYWGCPTIVAGQDDIALIWSTHQWDANLDDGLDSGWCAFEMSANANNRG